LHADAQFLVERGLADRLRTDLPFLVYGQGQQLRIPPGATYTQCIKIWVSMAADICRSLLDDAQVMRAVRVCAATPALSPLIPACKQMPCK
jgi:hypothetical protein